MAEHNITFTFYHENPANGVRTERNIRRSQATAERLALLFKLVPESLYIVEDYGEFLSEFPAPNGTFSVLQNADTGSFFKVEGVLNDNAQNLTSSSSMLAQRSSSGTAYSGAFRRSSLPGPSRKRSHDQQHALKIPLANVSNRRIGDSTRQNFFMISEATSNVDSITEMVREYFNDRELVLVNKDLLKYEDSEATRCFSFWKNSSRKFFAVKESHLQHRRTSPNQSGSTSDTSSSRLLSSLETLHEKVDRISSMYRLINTCTDIVRCMVCHSLPSGDKGVSGCCKQVIGCQDCLETWFLENDACPHCRSVRGSELVVYVNFFDELVRQINDFNSQSSGN